VTYLTHDTVDNMTQLTYDAHDTIKTQCNLNNYKYLSIHENRLMLIHKNIKLNR